MKDDKHNGEDKRPLLLKDLRNHSREQLAELSLLLDSGTPLEPIRESAAFFAVEGPLHVFYVCKILCGTKILLVAARKCSRLSPEADPASPQPTAVEEPICS